MNTKDLDKLKKLEEDLEKQDGLITEAIEDIVAIYALNSKSLAMELIKKQFFAYDSLHKIK